MMTASYRTNTDDLHDSLSTDRTAYVECSPFARWVFSTTAVRLWLKVYCNIQAAYPAFADAGIYVNGSLLQVATCTVDNAANVFAADLPAGSKTVEIVAGTESRPATTILGSYPYALYLAGGTATPVSPGVPGSRLLIYGDSIAAGGNADDPPYQAWPVLVRGALPVVVDAYGYRSLYDDGADSTARQAWVDRVVALVPSAVWLAIGTNDYGINKWSAADFGTAYADLLDKLHTALPAATIYAQTPLDRVTETANGSGSTLGDYRTQIATAQSARADWCTLVDGTAILAVTDLDDGVHPTTDGHALYAAYVKTVLGIS